jgi:hypothetical protein
MTDPPKRGVGNELVPLEVTSVAPGTEYLLKANGREVKEGIADTDKVNRRWRMPDFGDKARDVRLVLVMANDGCENSPWKLKDEMRYRPAEPAPQQEQPTQQPQPAPTPAPTPPVTQQAPPTPTPTPQATPPRVRPTPTPKPSLPQPSTVNPVNPVNPLEPPGDARAWVTPTDPYSKGSEKALQPAASTNPDDRQTENANSFAALVGLLGLFVVLFGIGTVAWTKFRRYDDEQLATLLNPDGKLPSMLDASAVDLGATGMTNASEQAKVLGGGLGVGGAKVVPNVAPAPAQAPAPEPAAPAQEPKQPVTAQAAPAPAAPAQPPPAAPAVAAPMVPPSQIKAPIVPPVGAPANGAHVGNGAAQPAPVEEAVPQAAPAPPAPAPAPAHRSEVDSELQRILNEAGVDTKLDGILDDARSEAKSRGVSLDSGQRPGSRSR